MLFNEVTFDASPKEILMGKNFLGFEPKGGAITRLQLGMLPVLVSAHRADGKTGVSHICFPMLGPDIRKDIGDKGLKQHGPARNNVWEILQFDPSKGIIKARYEIKEDSYPAGVRVTVTHSLSGSDYQNTTEIENNGEEPAPINPGWHLYWSALIAKGNFARAGFEGLTLNDKPLEELIANQSQVIDLSQENNLVLPDRYHVVVKQEGYPHAVLWVAQQDGRPTKKDAQYFALEPIADRPENFGTGQSLLAPGSAETLKFSISLLESLVPKQ